MLHQRVPIQIENSPLFFISVDELKDSFKATMHSHPNLEILFVTDGKGFIKTSTFQYEIQKGDLIIIKTNTEHSEISLSNLTFYALGVDNTTFIDKNNFANNILVYHYEKEEYNLLETIYKQIYFEAFFKKKNYEKIINNCFENLFIYIDRNLNVIFNENKEKEYSDLVSNIKILLDNSYSSSIKLDEIASHFFVSKATICHKFKKEVGQSIIEYKLNNQLIEAKNLLQSSHMGISQIAYGIGFNNLSHFNKEFKKKYGISPSEYRFKKKQNKKH